MHLVEGGMILNRVLYTLVALALLALVVAVKLFGQVDLKALTAYPYYHYYWIYCTLPPLATCFYGIAVVVIRRPIRKFWLQELSDRWPAAAALLERCGIGGNMVDVNV
jgi:hypothetical protein